MKKFTLTILAGLAVLNLDAQTKWSFDPAHTSVEFEISHMVLTDVTGKFQSFEGQVLADQEDFSDARIEFRINTGSINTENERRDKHLRSADFFDVEKYPQITFKSYSLKKTEGNRYILKGEITMHGVSRDITLDVVFNGTATDPWGNFKAGFRVSGTLNREEFGLTWNTPLENGDLLLGKEVAIICRVQLVKSS